MMMMLRLSATLVGLFANSSSALGYDDSFNLQNPSAQTLLRRATAIVEPAQQHAVDQQQAENDVYDNNYLYKYSIQYLGCTELAPVNNRDESGAGHDVVAKLVKFALCPRTISADEHDDGCSTLCSDGGLYVVDLVDFVDAYTEAKLNEEDYVCEMIRENCYCDVAYDDYRECENTCYFNAGMEACVDLQGPEDFEIQRYLAGCAGTCDCWCCDVGWCLSLGVGTRQTDAYLSN
jgi:hypothetical protein